MISSVLIPTDFSSASWKAIQVGLEFANNNAEARLCFMHVSPVSSRYIDDPNQMEFPPKIDQVEERMNDLTKGLIDHSEERIRNVVLSGNVGETMLNYIKENDFDLVIVGINSNGFDNKLGSHAMLVIEESATPVMVVPNNNPVNGIAAS